MRPQYDALPPALVFDILLYMSITIKKSTKKDVIILSRREYAALLGFRKIKEFSPTITQKKALLNAEKNFKRNKALTYNELVRKLGFKN